MGEAPWPKDDEFDSVEQLKVFEREKRKAIKAGDNKLAALYEKAIAALPQPEEK